MAVYDPDILATMTDEERAIILEEPSAEELAAIAAIAKGAENGSDDDDDDDDDLDGDDAGAKDAATTTEDKAPAGDTPQDPPNPEPEPEPAKAEKAFAPQYKASLPEDFAEQQAALQEQSDALASKFKEGDIDFDQYRLEAAALDKQARALDAIQLKVSLSEDMAKQSAEQQWDHNLDTFYTNTLKAEGIDYRKDLDRWKELDGFVRMLGSDDKNGDKSQEWFLTEAHKRVKALNGIATVAPTNEAKAKADAKAARKPPLDGAPKTLSQVPGGDGPGDVDGNEFSEVDRLTGDALDEAIAKMPAAVRERYMASA